MGRPTRKTLHQPLDKSTVDLLYVSPIPFRRGGNRRVWVRDFVLLVALLRHSLAAQGVTVALLGPRLRRTRASVLRAPYKNKNAWTPYTFAHYTYPLRITFTNSLAQPSGGSIRKLVSLVAATEVAHANLSMVRARQPRPLTAPLI
jgi:hypothetical protein